MRSRPQAYFNPFRHAEHRHVPQAHIMPEGHIICAANIIREANIIPKPTPPWDRGRFCVPPAGGGISIPRAAQQERRLPLEAREACAAVVNDMPVACQSRGGTERAARQPARSD